MIDTLMTNFYDNMMMLIAVVFGSILLAVIFIFMYLIIKIWEVYEKK